MSITVSNILDRKGREVATASEQDPVRDVVATLARRNIGALVVVTDAGAVAGIVSERDVVRQLARHGAQMLDLPVGEVMTSDVTTTDEGASTDDLMSTMTDRRIRHLPVVGDGRLVGIVSIGDVVKSRVDELEVANSSLQEYVSGQHY